MSAAATESLATKPTGTTGGPGELGHEQKCFMCGVVCADAATLDVHVIRCAKGQLTTNATQRRRDSLVNSDADTSAVAFEQTSEPPSTIPSHDVSFEAGVLRTSASLPADDVHRGIGSDEDQPQRSTFLLEPEARPPAPNGATTGVADGPMAHDGMLSSIVRPPSHHDGHGHGEELSSPNNTSAMDQTPTSTTPSANASPRPRRQRRAHTSHADVAEGTEEEAAAAAERRRRRFVMEEQLLSLESMQQANQERLRRQAQAGGGHGLTSPSLDTSVNESFSSPMLSSSQTAGTNTSGRMVLPAPRPSSLRQDALAGRANNAATGEVSPNAFLRHHTTVVWSGGYDSANGVGPAASPSPSKDQTARSPVLGARQDPYNSSSVQRRTSLERSSSAAVLPSEAPRRATIAPHVLPPASSPSGATRTTAVLHKDPAARIAGTSPLPQRAPFRAFGRSTAAAAPVVASTTKQREGRTSSSDGRSRVATSSPQPLSRRSSTVAGQKRNALPPSQHGSSHNAPSDVAQSLNSSVEGPRTEQPVAPMPRASTALRQRTQPITAISTSKIQSLLPPSRKVGADTLSSSLRAGTNGAAAQHAASFNTTGHHAATKGGSTTTSATAARRTAPTAPSSIGASATNGAGYSSKIKKPPTTASDRIAALSSSTAAGSHPKTPPSTTLHLTVSSGSVSVGGAVPQPHHSTLRAPNKRPLTSASLHPSTTTGAAASPPNTRGVVPPPPPLRHPTASSSMPRRSTSPLPAGSGGVAVVIFCIECGHRYVEGAKFCAFCGHRREDHASPTTMTTSLADRKGPFELDGDSAASAPASGGHDTVASDRDNTMMGDNVNQSSSISTN